MYNIPNLQSKNRMYQKRMWSENQYIWRLLKNEKYNETAIINTEKQTMLELKQWTKPGFLKWTVKLTNPWLPLDQGEKGKS